MEVILREDVDNLGSAGEVVQVKPGYGRNYLIPQGLAFEATAGNKKRVENEARYRAARLQEQQSQAEEVASKMNEVFLTFTAKAAEDGEKLFGSVTSGDIASKLADEGFRVDRKQVELAEPIKTLGDHTVPVRLHPEVRADVKISVVRE